MEKGGGWKTSRMTPLPKRGFGPPPRTVRFPPPSGVSALFFLYKNPRQSRPEALLEGSKNFRESAFSGTFSSPHTFCTPPYHGPNIGRHVMVEFLVVTNAQAWLFSGLWSCSWDAMAWSMCALSMCAWSCLRCLDLSMTSCLHIHPNFLSFLHLQKQHVRTCA